MHITLFSKTVLIFTFFFFLFLHTHKNFSHIHYPFIIVLVKIVSKAVFPFIFCALSSDVNSIYGVIFAYQVMVVKQRGFKPKQDQGCAHALD